MASFEVVSADIDSDRAAYEARADGFPFQVELYFDMQTTAFWRLPPEYGYLDFLRVMEQMFVEAEADGYIPPDIYSYVLNSNKLIKAVEGELTRPYGPGDFEGFGVKDEDIEFLQLGDDLAQANYYGDDRSIGVLFDDRPHQTRTGVSIMANLFPSRLRLEPAEVGQFVIGLERP